MKTLFRSALFCNLCLGLTLSLGFTFTFTFTLNSYAKPPASYGSNVDYKAIVETIGESTDQSLAQGQVFRDKNRNGSLDKRERGIAGVLVSNGVDVVTTDDYGYYSIPAYEGMSLFITEPAGYDVPVNDMNVPQFFYHHLPNGSPPLRFGGLKPTGPLPAAINFPLIKSKYKHRFKMIVIGDTQPYSNTEISYVRDTLAKEFADMNMRDVEGLIVEGDVMGDDLGLFPRFKEIMSIAGVPQYYVGGNHDLDFDAPNDAHSFDTFKREWGPAYYSFDIGRVHFVTLDNVQYPCTNYDGEHAFCDSEATYNGVISKRQMEWLANDLAHVPMDKLVVINLHIPLVSFVDSSSNKHQTDNAADLYALLDGRPALSLSGHTHTLEHFEPGEGARPNVSGVDIPASPFPQIIAGAGCGSWWTGDFDEEGIPMSYQRLGGKRGYLVFEFNGNRFRDTFKATGMAPQKQINVGVLSPAFNHWYDELLGWLRAGAEDKPPLNINELADTRIVPRNELADTEITANVWNGSSATKVYLKLEGRKAIKMQRSEVSLDPFALKKQMYVFRYAAESNSGNQRSQGFELFGGSSNGPSSPRPSDEWQHVDNSNHLWKVALPVDLENGVHKATVTAIDKYKRKYSETVVLEVREQRPDPLFRDYVFE
ncbi:MAG: calcineurin-like phosphoesterase family protein [Cellvibrionaceae bacterium]|nr:calcineurin-like phosphoesterase family protein [Cellvibrionaceae bacterium]